MPRSVFLLGLILPVLLACSDEPSKPAIMVDFSWQGIKTCSDTSPEIHIQGIPKETIQLHVSMFDKTNAYEHGGCKLDYDGSGVLPQGALKGYRGPCPSYGSPRYEFTVEALGSDGKVLARGKKMRRFPPEE